MVQSYRQADGHDARGAARRRHDGPSAGQRRRTAPRGAPPDPANGPSEQLRQLRPLVAARVAQTRARLLGGDTHVPDKVLSVFEPHTTTIRKGKISKPNEFGNLVTIQESEHQIITAYEVHAGRPADVTLWTPALDRHQRDLRARAVSRRRRSRLQLGDQRTGRHRPRRATRDLAARAGRSRRRDARTNAKPGSGAVNAGASDAKGASVCIKRRHGLRRCRYHGTDGMARWVGLGVIADNLINIGHLRECESGRVTERDEMNRPVTLRCSSRIASPAVCDRSFLHRKVASSRPTGIFRPTCKARSIAPKRSRRKCRPSSTSQGTCSTWAFPTMARRGCD